MKVLKFIKLLVSKVKLSVRVHRLQTLIQLLPCCQVQCKGTRGHDQLRKGKLHV
jgi:hypothetical protein